MTAALRELIGAELAAPVLPEVRAFAERLAGKARRPPLAVLFYGSALRTGSLEGILDFYVIVSSIADWSHGALAAGANRLLPPNVEYHEEAIGGETVRGKVAILSLDQFRRHCTPSSLDNSVWARFSQPVALAFARDVGAADDLADAVAGAVAAAAVWAVRLGPGEGTAASFWRGLFRRTYQAELRVERAGRSDSIVGHAAERYERVFPLALEAAGIPFERRPDGRILISLTDGARRRALRAWNRRRRLAKPLNLARLLKAAFTFRGGADYIAWKIGRHSGAEIRLTERQRRHPVLASGWMLRELWRRRTSG